MPKLLSLRNMGLQGINTDVAPWELPPENITDGRNFRPVAGSVSSVNSASDWYASAVANLGFIMPCNAESRDMYLLAGSTGVWGYDGTTHANILDLSATPVDADGWSGCLRGGVPVVNHPSVGAFYWLPASLDTELSPLPFDKNVPTYWDGTLGKSAVAIRAHKNFLFMLRVTETISGSPTELMDGYRWSHPADINGIPPTWDETDQNYLAGLAQLGGDTGRIVDGLSLGDSFIIYSDRGINALDPSGDVFVWNRRPLLSTAGLLAKDCLVEANGVHYLMTAGDIVAHDGNSVRSLMSNRLRRHLQANLSAAHYDRSFAVSNKVTKEIWFCVPTQGDWPDLAYVYNWQDDAWSIRDLPSVSFGAFGSKSSPTILWETLEAKVPQPKWRGNKSLWGSGATTPYDDTVIGVDIVGQLMDLDPLVPVADTGAYIERTDFPLEGGSSVTTITRLYPHARGSGPFRITVGSQDYPGAPVRWRPSVQFDPEQQRKVEVRTTGALHAWRIEGIEDNAFSLSGFDIEYSNTGAR